MMGRENAVALQTQRHCGSMQLPEYCTLACQWSYDKGTWFPCGTHASLGKPGYLKAPDHLSCGKKRKTGKEKKAPLYCHCSLVGVFVKADRNVHGHFEWREHLPDIPGAKNRPRDTQRGNWNRDSSLRNRKAPLRMEVGWWSRGKFPKHWATKLTSLFTLHLFLVCGYKRSIEMFPLLLKWESGPVFIVSYLPSCGDPDVLSLSCHMVSVSEVWWVLILHLLKALFYVLPALLMQFVQISFSFLLSFVYLFY